MPAVVAAGPAIISGLRPTASAYHPHGRLNSNLPAANADIVAPISVAFAPNSRASIGSTGLAHACPDMSAALVRHTDATAAWSRAKAYATPEGADASRADAARASVDSREPASSALGRDDDDDDDDDDGDDARARDGAVRDAAARARTRARRRARASDAMCGDDETRRRNTTNRQIATARDATEGARDAKTERAR